MNGKGGVGGGTGGAGTNDPTNAASTGQQQQQQQQQQPQTPTQSTQIPPQSHTHPPLQQSPLQQQQQQQQYPNVDPNNPETAIGLFVGNSRYMIKRYFSSGSFGSLFVGVHIDKKYEVAIKMELTTCDKPQLHLEYGFYKKLSSLRKGVPKIYTFGPCGGGVWNALVMELLGPNLDKMLTECGGRFSLRCTIQLTIQFLFLFRGIHECGILYRDTKPANFLLGPPDTSKWWIVHVIDLGFCKEWRMDDGSHIPYMENKPYTGTVRYMSINNNMGHEQSRRDDLEALAYMLIYFYKGRLPWQGIQTATLAERYIKICHCKINTPLEVLCSNMPEEYERFLRMVRTLQFDERPNYSRMINLFINLLAREYLLDRNDKQQYDWTRDHKVRDSYIKHLDLGSYGHSTTNFDNDGLQQPHHSQRHGGGGGGGITAIGTTTSNKRTRLLRAAGAIGGGAAGGGGGGGVGGGTGGGGGGGNAGSTIMDLNENKNDNLRSTQADLFDDNNNINSINNDNNNHHNNSINNNHNSNNHHNSNNNYDDDQQQQHQASTSTGRKKLMHGRRNKHSSPTDQKTPRRRW